MLKLTLSHFEGHQKYHATWCGFATPIRAVLGVLGLLFVLIGRKREHKIGYSSRD